MHQVDDAEVIQAALVGHLTTMQAVEVGHRRAARALSLSAAAQQTTPPAGAVHDLSPTERIMLSAAHRARCASYAQRAAFLEELTRFPVAGLKALSAHDIKTLHVPEHIGRAAAPVAETPEAAESTPAEQHATAEQGPTADPANGHTGQPERPTAADEEQAQPDDADAPGPVPTAPSPKPSARGRSFFDVIYGWGSSRR